MRNIISSCTPVEVAKILELSRSYPPQNNDAYMFAGLVTILLIVVECVALDNIRKKENVIFDYGLTS